MESSRIEFTPSEVDLLGRLLRGERRSSPARSATHLVRLGLASWVEPGGHLALTDLGRDAAQALWPGVEPQPAETPAPRRQYAAEAKVSRQLRLGALEGRKGPATDLRSSLAGLLDDDGLADVVLDHYPQGRGLESASAQALVSVGLRPRDARTLVHAFAVARAAGRRLDVTDGPPLVESPAQMAALIHTLEDVQHLEVEHLWVCSLDARQRLIEIRATARGSLTRVEAHMRDIFTPLLRARAACCYIAHNHPSGDLEASDHDVRLAQRVASQARLFEIELLDALILSPDGSFVSLSDQELL